MNDLDEHELLGIFLAASNGSDPEEITKAAATLICVVVSSLAGGNAKLARDGVLAVGKDMAQLIGMKGFSSTVAAYTGDKASH